MSDSEIITLINSNPEKGISVLFKHFYTPVCQAIFYVLKDKSLTEDVAQDVFHDFWKKRDQINVSISLGAYLKRAGVNKAINLRNKKKVQTTPLGNNQDWHSNHFNSQQNLEAKELEIKIKSIIDELPPKCKEVFIMSRYGEMSYAEISVQLGISPKTVENQISKALKALRAGLKNYMKR